jgi:hypothetical protein
MFFNRSDLLLLFVPRVRADDPDYTMPLDNLAFGAYLFD